MGLDIKDSEEAYDGSQEATHFKRTFKYKSSHQEVIIVGNKDNICSQRWTLNVGNAFND